MNHSILANEIDQSCSLVDNGEEKMRKAIDFNQYGPVIKANKIRQFGPHDAVCKFNKMNKSVSCVEVNVMATAINQSGPTDKSGVIMANKIKQSCTLVDSGDENRNWKCFVSIQCYWYFSTKQSA